MISDKEAIMAAIEEEEGVRDHINLLTQLLVQWRWLAWHTHDIVLQLDLLPHVWLDVHKLRARSDHVSSCIFASCSMSIACHDYDSALVCSKMTTPRLSLRRLQYCICMWHSHLLGSARAWSHLLCWYMIVALPSPWRVTCRADSSAPVPLACVV